MNATDELEKRLGRAGARLAAEPPDLSTAAAAAGMLDVAYATTDSPLGPLLLASTETLSNFAVLNPAAVTVTV